MPELSPAAQAVLDACGTPTVDSPFRLVARGFAAAALRAAADQVVPEQPEPGNDAKWRAFVRYEERNSLRIKLLAIATELECQ